MFKKFIMFILSLKQKRVQEIELIQDVNAQPDAEYKTNITKFQRVENISIFIV